MKNHTVKAIKDQLDLASKLIFQTSDGNFVGQNALNAIESGDILVHNVNEPLTQLANNSHDITALQNFGAEWKALGNEINGISDAMQGEVKAGAAWRQTEALLAESHSLFEIMTENKGIHIEEMMRNFVIPFLKTKMNTADEISATLEDYDITKIDSIYIPNEAIKRSNNKVVTDAIAYLQGQGEAPQATIPQQAEQIQSELAQSGNQRFFVPSDISDLKWNEYFKHLEWTVDVDVTGENRDAQATITTLTTVLQTLATNPMILQDKNARLVFNKILGETSAISPLEIASVSQTQPTVPQAVGGGNGGLPVIK
jgi:hypothetical protein